MGVQSISQCVPGGNKSAEFTKGLSKGLLRLPNHYMQHVKVACTLKD